MLAAIKGEKTLTELSKLLDVDLHQVTAWKSRLQQDATGIFVLVLRHPWST